MDFWMGLYLVSLLNMVCCLPEASYTIHLDKRSFKDAQNYCTPGSFLTDIPNEKETAKILKAVWEKNNKTATLFWIGLKKYKGNCVKQNLPLKGFYWMVDNSTQSNGITWKTTPTDTCIDERCGLLSVEYDGYSAKSSGAVDAACKQTHPFICKRNVKVACPKPYILGTHDIIENPSEPFAQQIICSSDHKFNLKCSNDLVWTVVGHPNMDVSQLCLQCEKGLKRDSSGNCVDINECELTNPCKYRCVNTEGSYKCACLDNDDNSDACNESTPPTTDPKNSNAEEGKSVNQPIILPDETSTNKTIVLIEESTGVISYIIVPVIIALLIFVVLLVIIAAIIKGCLRRRSIKLARRKAEAVALNGSSYMEKVNEKEET
ncbi:C-type lectin domain family 14 member A [Myxocyprinus asiaticus]|uniref:C-type lectin domain family 14 member A n=1 Tax=Myxocyprinus asiaticus TaxID=70543 RepID=UPI002223E5F3|nr:C-type lectin domain family 14 member A [Myxocyprinus asiaticus]